MQFGIGILGKNFDFEAHRERARNDRRDASPHFLGAADRYAAKLAADTILSEPSSVPDLSDEGLVEAFVDCVRQLRPSEVGMVREAYLRLYGVSS